MKGDANIALFKCQTSDPYKEFELSGKNFPASQKIAIICVMQKQLELLKKYSLSVKGIRGQHFLVDPNIQRKIIESVHPQPSDVILEIGPGLGAITENLLQSGARVVAVELDEKFCDILKQEYGSQFKNFTVIHADILSIQFDRLLTDLGFKKNQKIKVVGNIPYYITTPILLCLISNRNAVSESVLMMQEEIVDRLTAQPGTKNYGRLSLLAKFYTHTERAFRVPPGCFSPKPKVNSAVVRITFHGQEPQINEALFFEIVKCSFAHRRKNILNSISHEMKDKFQKSVIEEALSQAGINPKKRSEELLLKDFLKLAEILNKKN